MPVVNGGTPGKGRDRFSGKPGPIKPQGLSRQLPFLLALLLIIALYGGYNYLLGSDLYQTAERFVRHSQEVKGMVGEVRSCRPWYPLSVAVRERKPVVHLTLAVEGTQGATKVAVKLVRREGDWHVVSALYEDAKGRMRPLPKTEK